MEITLSPDAERIVRELIATGKFTDESAVVNAALTFMRLQQESTPDIAGGVPWTQESLRAALQAGLDQLARGESAEWDAQDIKDRVRKQLERESGASAKRAG
jgi:putative addiction module CopG family antidote